MTMVTGASTLMWDPYFIRRGSQFYSFWEEYLQSGNRELLCVLGLGFDPRMCTAMRALLAAGGDGLRGCLLVEFDEGPDSPSVRHASLVSDNLAALEQLLGEGRDLQTKQVRMWSGDGPGRRRVGSRSAAQVFSDVSDFEGFTDIAIDVSALPRGICFSLIGKALYILHKAKRNQPGLQLPNLHVLVTEDAALDQRIRYVGIDETAGYVHGFGGDLEAEATAGTPQVWIPILGEGQRGQLERIYTLVNPDEICPVLPSPSFNPRRADQLLIEYRELLFDQWRVEPKNIIYASEQNPFEAYRQIHEAVLHYNQALKALRGCKAVVSALASKLLSIGGLLATYELKKAGISVGLAHVEAQGYEIAEPENSESVDHQQELFTLWLAGDCYGP